jgi:hypothetical protein
MIASMGEQIGLRLVAEHADMWHVYGHKDQVTHKTNVLKSICDEAKRDFNTIELTTFHVPQYLGSDDADPGVYLKLGIRHIIGLAQGPDWSLDGLKDLLAWRKSVTG